MQQKQQQIYLPSQMSGQSPEGYFFLPGTTKCMQPPVTPNASNRLFETTMAIQKEIENLQRFQLELTRRQTDMLIASKQRDENYTVAAAETAAAVTSRINQAAAPLTPAYQHRQLQQQQQQQHQMVIVKQNQQQQQQLSVMHQQTLPRQIFPQLLHPALQQMSLPHPPSTPQNHLSQTTTAMHLRTMMGQNTSTVVGGVPHQMNVNQRQMQFPAPSAAQGGLIFDSDKRRQYGNNLPMNRVYFNSNNFAIHAKLEQGSLTTSPSVDSQNSPQSQQVQLSSNTTTRLFSETQGSNFIFDQPLTKKVCTEHAKNNSAASAPSLHFRIALPKNHELKQDHAATTVALFQNCTPAANAAESPLISINNESSQTLNYSTSLRPTGLSISSTSSATSSSSFFTSPSSSAATTPIATATIINPSTDHLQFHVKREETTSPISSSNSTSVSTAPMTVLESLQIDHQQPTESERRKKDTQNDSNYTKNLIKGFRRFMSRLLQGHREVLDKFLQYFYNNPLSNEFVILLLERSPYCQEFQDFLSEDPTWWIQEAKIKDQAKQKKFFQIVQERKFTLIRTKRKTNRVFLSQAAGRA